MNPLDIIQKYYDKDSDTYRILVEHSRAVADKALEVAGRIPELNPDLKFIEESAMLHDIGIFLTDCTHIGCNGNEPYIKHGLLGREILEKEGLPKHAIACERHLGTGLSIDDIKNQNLPLPKRDMSPMTLEEEVVAFADNFFGKIGGRLRTEKTPDEIRESLSKFGDHKVKRFNEWIKKFKEE